MSTNQLTHISPKSMSVLVKPDRPMATVNRVLARNVIDGADSIESVTVLGWNCVTKKEEFAVGDLCIYFTIGTVFPADYPRTDFLRGKPLKTKVLRGSLSQGLVAPISWVADFGRDPAELNEGDDVTEVFGLMKFVEAEEALMYSTPKQKMTTFPSYVPKTDEERIQNIPHILPYLVGKDIVVTRKEDGCSATFITKDGKFVMCSRNLVLGDMNNGNQHFFRVADSLGLRERLLGLGRNLAFQGEIVGPKIGCNRLALKGLSFRVFNVFDIDAQEYLSHSEVEELCATVNLEMVPVLFQGVVTEDDERFKSVASILDFAGSITYGPNSPAEGIVVKGNYRYSRMLSAELPPEEREASKRLSFKVISNNYLIKYKL